MKKIISSSILIIISIIGLTAQIGGCIYSTYSYNKRIKYAWNMADKSSTLIEKSTYINEYVNILESGKEKFRENSAVIFPTPNTDFQKNLRALKSLQTRLNEMKKLDEKSVAYQMAIQQITAQEQGEAQEMLSVISECWYLENYPWFISFYLLFIIFFILEVFFLFAGLVIAFNE